MKYLFIILFCYQAMAVEVIVEPNVIGNTHKNYLSYAIDTAQIVGGKWWDENGETEQPPLNLDNKKLVEWTKALGPSFLRIGGSEADKVFLDFKGKYKKAPKGFKSIMTSKQWSDLQVFLKQTNKELLFTLNAGPGVRKKGKWTGAQLETLLNHIKERKDPMPIFELGNEVNAFWLFYGLGKHVGPRKYAKDYVKAKEVLRKHTQVPLAGPSYAIWPVIGEPLQFLFGSLRVVLKKTPDLDILSWHYYPTQSKRCGAIRSRKAKLKAFLKPKTYDEVQKMAFKVKKWRDKYSPDTKIWMSETGPSQCGGVKGLNDRFIDSFWWLDQLGTLAKIDTKVVVRQTIVGADYSLIRSPEMQRTPDYWASILWKKYMGQKVLKVNYENKYLRLYAHCSPNKGTSILAINLSSKSRELKLPKLITEYSLLSSDELLSKDVLINGVKAQEVKSLSSRLDKKEISLLPWSIAFLEVPELNNSVCH